ncbi:regulatory signaling modulator protein AmpE [uncultured Legionella sp.]|uniref:regulatory signaling modulator protein AmpE n=1 Tax=uncultured Legionella sp. TaxID=210934 RepID=UPI00260D3DCF|nr:regulatory signaling modulator protein AmpE [uncultured Legionella sp.]
MKLMVVVLCLLSERFLIHSLSYQRFSWFGNYVSLISKSIKDNHLFCNPWMMLGIIILPIITVTSVVYLLFCHLVWGLAGLILSALIFFYCLGPDNAFYPLSKGANGDTPNAEVAHYFALVNGQLFTVIFWYVIGGPIAALTYRLFSLSRATESVHQQATQVTEILEWVPARITALLFLLVGNFQRGFATFIKYMLTTPNTNNQLLSECGLHAVRVDDVEEVPIPAAEALVEQAVIVLVVFIALFTLVAWL